MIEKVGLALIVAFLGLIVWFIQRAVTNADNAGKELVKSNVILGTMAESLREQSVINSKNSDKINDVAKQLAVVITKQDGHEKIIEGIQKKT